MAGFYLGLAISVLSLVCGVLFAKFPDETIKFQQYFYSKINWRMEPISLEKEIKNTRLMGIFLLLLALLALYFIFRRW